MSKKTIGFMFFFLFSEYHAFGVDDLSVDDEGVEVHAGQERRGTDLDAAVAEGVDGIIAYPSHGCPIRRRKRSSRC